MRTQDRIAQMLREYGMSHDAYIRGIDCMTELGDVSNDMLQYTDFGREPRDDMRFLHAQIGDVCFSLIALAHVCNVDIEQAREDTMRTYQQRYTTSGRVSSGA